MFDALDGLAIIKNLTSMFDMIRTNYPSLGNSICNCMLNIIILIFLVCKKNVLFNYYTLEFFLLFLKVY